MKKIVFINTLIIIVLLSCQSGKRKSTDQSGNKLFEVVEAWRTDTVLLVPESVIYDKKRDILYVSNLNYEPRVKDGNGFISQLSADGKILNLRWIEGLSSPKGLAIVGDTLYAADIDEVVVMDIIKGTIIKKVTIDGIKMINDITSDPDGNLYISDTDANKIYKYTKGQLSVWLAEGLLGPNGLLFDGSRLLMASQGSKDFASIDLNSKVKTVLTEGVNRGDGIAYTGFPGYYIVSDWEGEVFLINPDNTKVTLLNTKAQKGNCADLTYIPEKNLLLLPTFFKKNVIAYKLVEK